MRSRPSRHRYPSDAAQRPRDTRCHARSRTAVPAGPRHHVNNYLTLSRTYDGVARVTPRVTVCGRLCEGLPGRSHLGLHLLDVLRGLAAGLDRLHARDDGRPRGRVRERHVTAHREVQEARQAAAVHRTARR